MILELLASLVVASLVSVLVYLITLAANNRRKYQFFKKNAPGLKVLENPSLFGGHTNQVYHNRYNCKRYDELFEKYGPTFGVYFGSNPGAFTKDLDFIKVFTIDEQTHTNRGRLNIPWKEMEDSIMFAEDDQWLRLRKAIAPALSSHKIKTSNVHVGIQSTIDKFVNYFELQLDEAKQLRQENFIDQNADEICHRFTLDLVFTNFYKQKDVVDFHSKEEKLVSAIDGYIHDMLGFFTKACAAFPALVAPLNWLILNFRGKGDMRNTIMNFIKQQTMLNFEAAKQAQEKGLNDGEDAGDFTLKDGSMFRRNMVDYISDQYRRGKLTRSEYFNSTFFLFIAADKTTADCLARCLFNLANNQDVQEKLRESIMLSGADSEYLSWVIHETLRMNPSAPVGCSRIIERDIQTKHGLVPAGTFVVTPARTIGRLKEYWGEDAEEFRPERWANAETFHPLQFLAFGAGKRRCPGKEYAMLEMRMLLDALVRRYKFDKSAILTHDNSEHFTSPVLAFIVYDTPTYVKVSRLPRS